jgi:predicted nuclease with TOPRIM domain
MEGRNVAMKHAAKFLVLAIMVLSLVSMTGCGISKSKYGTLLSEKIALEERVALLTGAKDALKNEYDGLLKQKMELDDKITILTNEKAALKGEYDKILDEKVTLRASYDKLVADTRTGSAKR